MLLAVPWGILGAHRFYLNRPFTGLLMLLSAGGGLVWWVWDLFLLQRMVNEFNNEEANRRAEGAPPQGLGFLPSKDELQLNSPPAWASLRSGRRRIFGSGILLFLIGIALGSISGATGLFEPVIVLVLFIFVSLLAARWRGMGEIPVARSLARWAHRLRLYYHTVDPGNVWYLAARPIIGVFVAPWQPKARAEIRLYLELGVVFALLLAVPDIVEMYESGFWVGFGLLVAEFAQTLVYTYLFVAPAGALLTTQLLLTRRDRVVWVLSAINLGAVYLGLGLVT